ncbi:MAG: hypothetical protein WCC06_07180 [Candidatus Aminicenantales bacterium]
MRQGYTLIVLLLVILVLSIGLLVAVPVWDTQIQREKEEELIFRGKQYVEAIRIFQMKNPGRWPQSLEELVENRYLRRLYEDPMTREGKWNVILPYQEFSGGTLQKKEETASQKILVILQDTLKSIRNPRIIGVVSSSTKKSIKIYYDNDRYDHWLFYYGQNPNQKPEIVYYGQAEK